MGYRGIHAGYMRDTGIQTGIQAGYMGIQTGIQGDTGRDTRVSRTCIPRAYQRDTEGYRDTDSPQTALKNELCELNSGFSFGSYY